MKFTKLNIAFGVLWLLAIALFCTICYIITLSSFAERKTLLVPFGVLISAMLASVSVMKSIQNSKDIEERKRNDDIEKNKILAFSLIEIAYIDLRNQLLKVRTNTYTISDADLNDFKEKISTATATLNKLLDRDIFYYIETKNQRLLRNVIPNLYSLSDLIQDINMKPSKTLHDAAEQAIRIEVIQSRYKIILKNIITLLENSDLEDLISKFYWEQDKNEIEKIREYDS